jgi:hypothetical protein
LAVQAGLLPASSRFTTGPISGDSGGSGRRKKTLEEALKMHWNAREEGWKTIGRSTLLLTFFPGSFRASSPAR